jgi:hypothetical protein
MSAGERGAAGLRVSRPPQLLVAESPRRARLSHSFQRLLVGSAGVVESPAEIASLVVFPCARSANLAASKAQPWDLARMKRLAVPLV